MRNEDLMIIYRIIFASLAGTITYLILDVSYAGVGVAATVLFFCMYLEKLFAK